jgi:F subunit of K+-transporting ATPase (Potass_KdpF)
MKQAYLQLTETLSEIWLEWRRQKLPLYLFGLLCLNLAITPAVQASTGGAFSRSQAYALGVLGLVTFAVSIYLFTVMFQPEKF